VAGDNLMYTVHFYACDHREFQRNQAQVAHAAGLPSFVTEWGATAADGGVRTPTGLRCRRAGLAGSPANGGWTDEWLNGHARFVVDRLLE
jgi:hypothetical protein